jgi:uncharacterized protein YbaA (DUF1428 family)
MLIEAIHHVREAGGKVTDFRKSVEAKPDEKVVFAWFEYPDKATRDAANEKMRSDERMKEIGADMPFDGKRMIYGGSTPRRGGSDGGYVDGRRPGAGRCRCLQAAC